MRKIQFRGLYKGIMVYGNLIQGTGINGEKITQIEVSDANDFAKYDVDHKTVGQCVNITDKNGKVAYVGNIYKAVKLDGTEMFYKIFEVEGGFAVNTHQDDFKKNPEQIIFYSGLSDMQTASWFKSNLEEIGNIYDNQQLLK